jgi:hypothetical protein
LRTWVLRLGRGGGFVFGHAFIVPMHRVVYSVVTSQV